MASIKWPAEGGSGSSYWSDSVANVGLLPATGTTGQAILVQSTQDIYEWNGTAWQKVTDVRALTAPTSTTVGTVPTYADTTGLTVQSTPVGIDASGNVTGVAKINATTSTELGYVHGVTSAIQAQIDAKVAKAGDSLTGTLTFDGTHTVTGLPTPSATSDAATKAYADTKVTKAGDTMTGTLTLAADPVGSLDAATKQYVDAKINGVVVKPGVLCATTANITLSGEQTIDGIATSTSRVLVKNQTTQSQNGIYVSAAGAWSRASDAATTSELQDALVTVEQGTTNANTGWYQTTDNPTIGTSNIVFNQFFGAGTYTADGQGITLSGSTFSLALADATLTKSGSGLAINPITASKAMVSDASGKPSASATTSTEIGYVSGVTSSIQTQLNAKANSSSLGTMASQNASNVSITGGIESGVTHTGLVVSNYEDMTEVATPATPGAGILRLYAKSDDNLYVLTPGGIEKAVGGGAGEKNYISATSQSTASGWTASDANITVATDTTAADLPRAQTTKSGIKLTGVSGSTSYIYYRFTLDAADYNKKLKVQFDMEPLSAYASGDYRVDVYSNTASNYSGTSTRLPLSTDSSSVTSLTNATGTFRTAFDSPGSAAPYIEVRIGLNSANTHSLVISDVIIGPGVITQGAAVSAWQSVTLAALGSIANTFGSAYMRRVGETMELIAEWNITGASTNDISFSLPTGYTANTGILTGSNTTVVGIASAVSTSAGSYAGTVVMNSSGTLFIRNDGESTSNNYWGDPGNTEPFAWANGNTLSVRISVPVNEWSGSGTVNVAQNDRQYYYCSGGTWGTSATTTTAQGQGGTLVGSSTPSGTSFQWTFTPSTPVPTGARPVLTISVDGKNWGPLGGNPSGTMVEQLRFDGTNYIGAQVGLNASGQIVATFGKYASGTSTAWNGSVYWRVEVGLPGQAIGFGPADASSAGLINTTTQTLAGTKTFQDGMIVPTTGTSASGQVFSGSTWTSSPNSASGNVTSYTVTEGAWLRLGNTVIASFQCVVTANTTGGWSFNMNVPVTFGTFASTAKANGTGAPGITESPLRIIGNTGAANSITVAGQMGTASVARTYACSFVYSLV